MRAKSFHSVCEWHGIFIPAQIVSRVYQIDFRPLAFDSADILSEGTSVTEPAAHEVGLQCSEYLPPLCVLGWALSSPPFSCFRDRSDTDHYGPTGLGHSLEGSLQYTYRLMIKILFARFFKAAQGVQHTALFLFALKKPYPKHSLSSCKCNNVGGK